MDIFMMGFALGAAAGGIIVFAWMCDRAPRIEIDPTETEVGRPL